MNTYKLKEAMKAGLTKWEVYIKIFIALWVIITFITWQANPAKWNNWWRAALMLGTFIFTQLIQIFAYQLKQQQERNKRKPTQGDFPG